MHAEGTAARPSPEIESDVLWTHALRRRSVERCAARAPARPGISSTVGKTAFVTPNFWNP